MSLQGTRAPRPVNRNQVAARAARTTRNTHQPSQVVGFTNQAALDAARARGDTRLNSTNQRVLDQSSLNDQNNPTSLGNQLTPPEKINTNQPSPQSVNATPFTQDKNTLNGPSNQPINQPQELSYNQASQNLNSGGLTGSALATAQQSLANKYRVGHQSATASGVAPSLNTSEARGQVAQYTPPSPSQEPDTAFVDTTLQQDPVMSALFKNMQDYFSPQKQRESLTSEYSRLTKGAGIDELNTQLMNMDKVINGTEDDIRNEVTKAGGFATDSQVQALANARNKSLIQNYNTLVETRNQQQKHVDTMLSLSQQDRQMADQRASQMFNMTMQIADYQQKMQDNSIQKFQWLAGQPGGFQAIQTAATSSPYYQNLINKTLGGVGGLDALISANAPKAQKLDTQYVTLPDGTSALINTQTGNVIHQYSTNNAQIKTITGKPQSADETKANGYADRMDQSDKILNQLGSKFSNRSALGGTTLFGFGLPNSLKSSDRQRYEQAQNNFLTAFLRRESGASISPTEFDIGRQTYFPQPGDSAATIKQKAETRNLEINNFYRESNIPRPVSVGAIIESNGKRYRVGSDGETLIEIK